MFESLENVILLSDMDGTLLNAKKQITDVDRRAIRRFMDMGGKFTVATGRTIQSFEQYRSMIELEMPIILYNGAAIHDFSVGKTLYTQPLPAESKTIAMEILAEMPESGGEVLKTDGTYVFSNTDYQKLHTKLCNIIPNYAELSDIEDGGWLKVLFSLAPEDVSHMELLVHRKGYDKIVDFVRSSEIFLEMLPKGISKGSALAEYRKLRGMECYTFVSIGDFDNDLEMIREADLGACPSNAEGSVKEAADLVLTHSCEDGAVAELIDHIINKCSHREVHYG